MFVHCIQTAKDIVKLFSRHGWPVFLVFDAERQYAVPSPFSWGANTRGWEYFALFDWNRRLFQKWYERGLWLLWNVNKKSYALSNGDIFNDLDGPLIQFSRSWHIWSRISQSYYRTLIGNYTQPIEWYHFQWPGLALDWDFKVAILGSHRLSVEWWHFQWPWRTSNPVFKVTAFLKSNISRTKLL